MNGVKRKYMEKDKLDSIKKQCIKKWGQKDEKIEQFEKNFDKWSIFSTDEEEQICMDLVERFDYYSKVKVNSTLKRLHKKFLEISGVNPEYTVYTFIKNRDGKLNSSLEYLLEYKFINEIENNLCREDIVCIKDSQYSNIDNIVIIDDCIGEGQTVRDFLIKYKERLKSKKIYLILIHAVSEYINKLDSFTKENGYNLTIICGNIKEKAFYENENNNKEKFEVLSENRQIPKKYILGRNDVEALVSFYNNTPNNTLGIFWFETENNVPLFPRRINKICWNKEKRKQQNYKNAGVNL